MTATTEVKPGTGRSPRLKRVLRGVRLALALVVLLPLLGFAAWTYVTLQYTYSSGERAGYLQKLSRRGWICKTWEGQLAMVNLPGAMPEIFAFSVRDDAVVRRLEGALGKRVVLFYEEHRGVPTSCFGDTNYFVTDVRAIEDGRATGDVLREGS